MRAACDIDDDLLAAARAIAQRERTSAGRVISRLLRLALTGQSHVSARQRCPSNSDKQRHGGLLPVCFTRRAGDQRRGRSVARYTDGV